MKRMIAFILATILMMSVTANAYGKEGSTTVEYVVSDSYEISIPETVSVSPNETKTISVGVSNKTSSDRVGVTVASRNFTTYQSFVLIHEANPNLAIGYTLSLDGFPITENNLKIGEFTTDGSVTLNLNLLSNGLNASGRYTDILTFTFG